MDIKHDPNKIGLTSSEVGYLWAFYSLNSPSRYAIEYVKAKCKDEDIRSVMQLSIDTSKTVLQGVENIFNSANFPIPHAFEEKDVDVNGDNMFTDTYWLQLLKVFTTVGLANYGFALSMVARSDVKQFMTNCLNSTIELSNKIDEVAIQKGIFVRTPYAQAPENIEFAKDKSILGSLIGKKRALTYMEIAHVFNISMTSLIGEALMAGYSQVVGSDKIKDYMLKGRKLFKEHAESLNTILENENINTPRTYETDVLKATVSPYSDRMLLFYSVIMAMNILSVYSVGKINSMRKDIFLKLTQLSSEVMLYLKDGTDIMIENGWYEEQPQVIGHEPAVKS